MGAAIRYLLPMVRSMVPLRQQAVAMAMACFLAVSCAHTPSGGQTSPAPSAPVTATVETILAGAPLDQPTALAFRPGRPNELWVTNSGNDSIAILTLGATVSAIARQDAFAEHFVAHPSGIAFGDDGTTFSVSNESNNEVRDMVFVKNPERNKYFKGSNFMGPTLFATETFGLAGQSKKYLEDWPQPGYGHDPPDNTPHHECPKEYWSETVGKCIWPREGSHIDMLHGNPLGAGILNESANRYFILDGCGTRDAQDNRVCNYDGHVALVDFNRDHQEGNGFHGDGTLKRFIDVPFHRVEGVPAGLLKHDGWVYYSDTGAGLVRRFRPESGTHEVVVRSWRAGGEVSRGERGPGVMDWSHVDHGPGDGDTPDVVAKWVQDKGNQAMIQGLGKRWIKPMEVLAEYVYTHKSTVEDAFPAGWVREPAGLAAGESSWFVADHATGRIHEFGWDGRPLRTFETGHAGIGGLAYADGKLYVTDVKANAVYRLSVR